MQLEYIYAYVDPKRRTTAHQAHSYLNSVSAAASKSSSLGSKMNPRRVLKTRRKALLMKRVRLLHFPVSLPRSYHRFSLRRNTIPIGFRIQRFKISLSPLKRMLKRSRVYKKIWKSRLQKATGKLGRSKQPSGKTARIINHAK